jgi:hypothetical protein
MVRRSGMIRVPVISWDRIGRAIQCDDCHHDVAPPCNYAGVKHPVVRGRAFKFDLDSEVGISTRLLTAADAGSPAGRDRDVLPACTDRCGVSGCSLRRCGGKRGWRYCWFSSLPASARHRAQSSESAGLFRASKLRTIVPVNPANSCLIHVEWVNQQLGIRETK